MSIFRIEDKKLNLENNVFLQTGKKKKSSLIKTPKGMFFNLVSVKGMDFPRFSRYLFLNTY